MSGESEQKKQIQDTLRDSMEEPSAAVKAKIAELITIYPRLLYPYMSESEFEAMMESRQKPGTS